MQPRTGCSRDSADCKITHTLEQETAIQIDRMLAMAMTMATKTTMAMAMMMVGLMQPMTETTMLKELMQPMADVKELDGER